MKKLLLFLLTILLPTVANAYDACIDGIYYNLNKTAKTATVTYLYSGNSNENAYSGTVEIPAIIDYNGESYSVTSIGSLAFRYCSSLTSVIIPNGVTSIGNDTFFGCNNLASVTISNGVTSIGNYAFYGCSSLASLTIPNGVTSIGYYAFYDCSSLVSVTIPNGMTSIANDTFSGCTSLASVTIPNSVTSIGNYAFSNCSSLASVTIHSGVTSIGRYAFRECSSLTSVYITDLSAWCKIAFDNFDSNPTVYAHHLYLNNVEITDLVIPDDVTSICSYAFYGCSSLTSATIPNSVTSIGDSTFGSCSSLTSITIPDGVTSIGHGTFASCDGLISVNIPNSVTSIGTSAFEGCSNLTSIIVPENITRIENRTFSNCSSLISVSIPKSVTTIGESAFNYCSRLTSVTIPENVTKIEENAFANCSSLATATIPNSVTSIGIYAFYRCESLNSVIIPIGITSIGDYTFSDCYALSSIVIPNSVTTIGNCAFRYCYNLTSVTIPSSVTTIGEDAFNYCQNLETLKLPDELKIIKKATFKWCSKLKSLTIPATVEYIYSEAFSGCDALESIKALPETPPFLYDNSFTNYSVPLIVPDGCKEAYQNAQGWKNFTNISDSKYQLTYLVDGEEYKSYIIEYGTPITPEAEPAKETYKFSGWSDIPETMPAHDVVVTGTFARYFDVGNLTKAIDFVMNSSASAEETVLYDLNNNEKMDVGDVILIVKFILSNIYSAPSYIGRRAGEITDLAQYTAAQFEVKTTGNVDLRLVKNMELTHQMMYQQKDANTYAVVVYSLSNQLMQPENGKIIETDNNSDILSIENVTVATPTGETAYYQTLSATTGIEQIENKNGTAVIYDLKGNRLNGGKAMNKGIYIVNGKKAVVR